jgi:hypothetical protein
MTRRDVFVQHSRGTPFDNSTNGFVSTDAQSAIEEVLYNLNTSASPGFSFGRSGQTTAGTYLQNETVPSNVSGRWVYINGAVVERVFISNELTTTFKIEALYHDGNEAGITSIGTVTVTAAKGGVFAVNWPVPTNKQIAIRVATDSANSAKNIVCGLQLSGTN